MSKMSINSHEYMYVCMLVCVHMCTGIYACICICMYICMHACMYACMYCICNLCTVCNNSCARRNLKLWMSESWKKHVLHLENESLHSQDGLVEYTVRSLKNDHGLSQSQTVPVTTSRGTAVEKSKRH